jgi:hypothetical protein
MLNPALQSECVRPAWVHGFNQFKAFNNSLTVFRFQGFLIFNEIASFPLVAGYTTKVHVFPHPFSPIESTGNEMTGVPVLERYRFLTGDTLPPTIGAGINQPNVTIEPVG